MSTDGNKQTLKMFVGKFLDVNQAEIDVHYR